MKVEILENYFDSIGGVHKGDILEVVRKKLPDKWNKTTRYLVLVNDHTNRCINVPESIVREIKDI